MGEIKIGPTRKDDPCSKLGPTQGRDVILMGLKFQRDKEDKIGKTKCVRACMFAGKEDRKRDVDEDEDEKWHPYHLYVSIHFI